MDWATLYSVILNLLILQGLMGAFDTIWHHELRCALPQQHNSAPELRLHAIRAVLYGVLFAGLAWLTFGGVWLVLLWGIIACEIGLTLRDFVIEDQTRSLPPSERVTHTVLAINGGVLFGLLGWHSLSWWPLPDQLVLQPHGWKSLILSLFAVGVVISGVRDALVSRAVAQRADEQATFDFCLPGRQGLPRSFLLTGGTGFIGQSLVRALLRDGHRVTVWARNPRVAAALFDGRVVCVGSLEQLNPSDRFDVVINLAGAPIIGPRWSVARKQTLLNSRVDTTRQLLAWLERAHFRPALFINGSAVGYYGVQQAGDTRVLDEQAQLQPGFASALCQQWEAAAHGATRLGIPLAILRLGVVYGYQGALPGLLMPFWLGLGGRLGDGRQVQSWVHIDDVLSCVAWLCRKPAYASSASVYNLVAPHCPTQQEWAITAARLMQRPAWFTTPGWLIRLMVGEQADILLKGAAISPVRLIAEGFSFRYPSLQAAFAQLLGKTGPGSAATGSVYQAMLGDDFAALPPVLQQVHGGGHVGLVGELAVKWSASRGLRCLLHLARLPLPANAATCRVTMNTTASGLQECWQRRIGNRPMVSHMSDARPGGMTEKIGCLRIRLASRVDADGQLHQHSQSVRWLGIPLPGVHIRASERAVGDSRYACDVCLSVNGLGELLHYTGTLALQS